MMNLEQPSLFSDDSEMRVAAENWRRAARQAIGYLAKLDTAFSLDDVTAIAGKPPSPFTASSFIEGCVRAGTIHRIVRGIGDSPSYYVGGEQPPKTLAEAQAEADAAIRRAYDGSAPEWREEALAAIRRVALVLAEFTSDDLWRAGLSSPREPRALGPMMRIAVRDGLIEPTGRHARSTRRHGALQPVWRSRIWKGGQ